MEKVVKADKLSADGVELMIVDPVMLDVDRNRSDLQQVGLEVAAIGSGAVGFATDLTLLHTDPDKANLAELRLRNLIDFAVDVGAPLVTIGSFR